MSQTSQRPMPLQKEFDLTRKEARNLQRIYEAANQLFIELTADADPLEWRPDVVNRIVYHVAEDLANETHHSIYFPHIIRDFDDYGQLIGTKIEDYVYPTAMFDCIEDSYFEWYDDSQKDNKCVEVEVTVAGEGCMEDVEDLYDYDLDEEEEVAEGDSPYEPETTYEKRNARIPGEYLDHFHKIGPGEWE